MFDIKGKTCIVTGASSGINLEFAKVLLSNGANVIIADLSMGTYAASLYEDYPNQAKFQKCDVTNWKEWDAVFSFARKEFGGVQVLCNGAGVYEPPWSNFWADTEDEGYKTIDINFTGTVRGTRLAIREFLRQNIPGVVINISSIAAQAPRLSTPIYAATKAAVSALTRSLAPLQKDYDIKVVAIAPGVVKTALWTQHPEKSKMLTDQDEWILPEEVASVMFDLVKEDIKYPGGTVLECSKGSTRIVEVDSPLPTAPGATVSNEKAVVDDIYANLDKERGRIRTEMSFYPKRAPN